MPRIRNILGERFGRLVAVEQTDGRNPRGFVIWRFRCDCGSLIERALDAVIHSTRSCGCLLRESPRLDPRGLRHGMAETPEWRVWWGMKRRCEDPGDRQYSRYGGRGIRINPAWSADFTAFFADMGWRPSRLHSIDRIDNNDDYGPFNCRWATAKEQSSNRRVTRQSVRDRALRAFGVQLGFPP